MKTILTLFSCSLLLLNSNIFAQTDKLATAFSKSYEYEALKDYASAINSLKNVYDAKSYETNLRLGWLYYSASQYKEAIVFYQKAIALMPAATEPLWAIINPQTKLELWNDIEKNYLTILKIEPKSVVASYQLGLIYYYRKDYINAKKVFDTSLNLYPFNYNYMLMSAWTNYFLGNKNDAITLFNKVLLYIPNDKSALEGLSLIK